jgi:hypothetical protein
MHTEASQERTRMVSGSVPKGRIGIAVPPSQDGSTVNDEITGSDEPSSDGLQNGQHEERLVHRSASGMAAFALLGFTRDTHVSIFAQWQATSKGQSRPTL